MVKTYKSKRDWIYGSIFLGISFLFLSIVVSVYFEKDLLGWIILAFIFLIVQTVLIINFFLLKIKIEGEDLVVNIIFDIFRVSIFKITKIRVGETMWSGFNKCGTSVGGLIIFSKYKNDLYITPENQNEFLKELLEINRHIVIEDLRKK